MQPFYKMPTGQGFGTDATQLKLVGLKRINYLWQVF